MVGASQSPFTKILIFCSVIVKSISLTCSFEVMDIGSKSLIIFLLYLHEVRCVGMDIMFTELQSKDALNFILALSCLSGLTDECAS